jgi:hypothetical protein
MEQKNIFNTLKITPDYMILLYTRFLQGEANADFTPMDYKKQIDQKTDINTIVEYLNNCGTREYDIWRDDENDTLTEKRAKILFRRITIKRLSEYLQDDTETTEKFRIQYLKGFRAERLKAMENYNKYFRDELKENGKPLNRFMYKAFRKLHRKDMTEEKKERLKQHEESKQEREARAKLYDHPCGCGGGYSEGNGARKNSMKARHEESEIHRLYMKKMLTRSYIKKSV